MPKSIEERWRESVLVRDGIGGTFSTLMEPRSAISTGWWMFWRGLWGWIRRKPNIVIISEWRGP